MKESLLRDTILNRIESHKHYVAAYKKEIELSDNSVVVESFIAAINRYLLCIEEDEAILRILDEIENNQNLPIEIKNPILTFFEKKATQYELNPNILFIENKISHLSLCAFTQYDSYILEEIITDL